MSRLRALLAAGGLPAVGSKATLTPESNPLPSAAPWPDILPFEIEALPKFPTYALPGRIRSWVESEARATQTPADLAGMLALAVCSAAIARRVVIEPYPGWREPTNLWVTVLLPGLVSGKSAVFADATAPLRELESELIEASMDSVATARKLRRQLKLRLRRLEKLAEGGDLEAELAACKLAMELDASPEPTLPRLIVGDATVGKLVTMLATQSGRIASMSTGNRAFNVIARSSSKRVCALCRVCRAGHSGHNLLINLRSGKDVLIERPAITCAYVVSPLAASGLASNVVLRARGLLARFLYACPDWMCWEKIDPAPVPNDVYDRYRLLVRALATIEGETTLRLTDEASERFLAWQDETEQMLRGGGALESMRDWGAELAGATLRLAGVLHCVDRGTAGQIEQPTVEAAIEIARYLIPHAELVLGRTRARQEAIEGGARRLLRWIVRRGCYEFTKREASRNGGRRFFQAKNLDYVLAELVKRGYIRPKPVGVIGPWRPPVFAYEVNPGIQCCEARMIKGPIGPVRN